MLEFERFIIPHTGHAACHFIYEVIKYWGLNKSIMAVATDNASDMVSVVRELNEKLRNKLGDDDFSLRVDNFHVRCLPHVVNLAVKDCMGIVHDKVSEIRSVLNTI